MFLKWFHNFGQGRMSVFPWNFYGKSLCLLLTFSFLFQFTEDGIDFWRMTSRVYAKTKISVFLVACTQLYKTLCRSVGRSVCRSVGRCHLIFDCVFCCFEACRDSVLPLTSTIHSLYCSLFIWEIYHSLNFHHLICIFHFYHLFYA